MRYRLTCLTPLLVGDGRKLSPIDYMVWKDHVNVLDQWRIFRLLAKGPRLEGYLTQLKTAEKLDFASWGGFAQNFAGRRIPFENAAYSNYWNRAMGESLHIPTFSAGAAGPYIPGTAIKGALRTGMVFAHWRDGMLQDVRARVESGERIPRRPAEIVEEMALGPAGSNRMRFVGAGDSTPIATSEFKVYLLRTSTLQTRGSGFTLGWKCPRGTVDGARPEEGTPAFAEMAAPAALQASASPILVLLWYIYSLERINNHSMARVGVVGYNGYSGAELVRILLSHPHAEPVLLAHREDTGAGVAIRNRRGPAQVPCTPQAVQSEGLAVVFLATPPDVSMELAPAMLDAGARVVDLSGAFRLRTPESYTAWYKEPHTQPGLLTEAVYGLPEFGREAIPGARLVSNPGCYPTAANLAIRPLIEAGVVDRSAGIVCDAKSGVSGAGRKPSLKTSFCEVSENFSAYSMLKHRHVPEVLLVSGLEEREFSFTAQLLPIDRGILETIYFRARGVASAQELLTLYEKRYAGEPFVRLYNPGHMPDLRSVARSNFCDIGVAFDAPTGRAVVVSAIDNLVKGAAGQAVQNMNLMLGFPETEGLL